jgi:hypothetical protein
VQFIGHGRSNDQLCVRTCVGSTPQAPVAPPDRFDHEYVEQRDAFQAALPDHATTAAAAQLLGDFPEKASTWLHGMAWVPRLLTTIPEDSLPPPRRGTTTRCAPSSLPELTQPQILIRDHGDITIELSGARAVV